MRILVILAAFGIARGGGLPLGLPLRTATAGAYFARLHGSSAIRLNPAGIAYRPFLADTLADGSAVAPFTLTLAGVSAQAANNAIDPHWFNSQLYADLDLRAPGGMERFLSVFSSDLWQVNIAAEAQSLALSQGNWGLSLFGYEGAAAWNIPADLLDVLFRGVRFDQPKDLSELDIRSYRSAPVSLGYSREVGKGKRPISARRLYVGAGVNLHLGLEHYWLQTDYLDVLSTSDRLTIQGQTNIHTTENPAGPGSSIPGLGLSFDVGFIAEIGDGLAISFALKDLLGKITWRDTYVKENRLILDFQADEFGNILEDYSDALSAFKETISQPDTTYSIATTTTLLPVLATAGGSIRLSRRLVVDAAGQLVLRQGDIPSDGPSVSLGCQYTPSAHLPLYAGVGFGGLAGFSWGAGLALHVRSLQWSVGFGQSGGIFNGAKGARLSTELRLVR